MVAAGEERRIGTVFKMSTRKGFCVVCGHPMLEIISNGTIKRYTAKKREGHNKMYYYKKHKYHKQARRGICYPCMLKLKDIDAAALIMLIEKSNAIYAEWEAL